jgi:hypothetical protein
MGQRIHEMPQIVAALDNGKDQAKKVGSQKSDLPSCPYSTCRRNRSEEHRALTLSREARR